DALALRLTAAVAQIFPIIAVLDIDIFSLNVAQNAKTLAKCVATERIPRVRGGTRIQNPNLSDSVRLLGLSHSSIGFKNKSKHRDKDFAFVERHPSLNHR
ncbi:MAG TPA: hypothetical protein VIE89_25080, partial [Candidatus Binatia bacterium]